MKHIILLALLSFSLAACSRQKTDTPPNGTPEDVAYGITVKERPGFVKSPYEPEKGWIDVRGFPANTEVRDPYSGKIFLVPTTETSASTNSSK